MSYIEKIIMSSRKQGLTVGELTIAIGALIIVGLIWSGISKRQEPNQSNVNSSYLERTLYLNIFTNI